MVELSKTLEDYIEGILMLGGCGGSVMSARLAEFKGVSKAGVVKAVAALKSFGFVEQERYGVLRLTESGRAYALKVKNRHNLLKRFLSGVLGVSDAVAEEDACAMEHVISAETGEKLEAYLKTVVKK